MLTDRLETDKQTLVKTRVRRHRRSLNHPRTARSDQLSCVNRCTIQSVESDNKAATTTQSNTTSSFMSYMRLTETNTTQQSRRLSKILVTGYLSRQLLTLNNIFLAQLSSIITNNCYPLSSTIIDETVFSKISLASARLNGLSTGQEFPDEKSSLSVFRIIRLQTPSLHDHATSYTFKRLN